MEGNIFSNRKERELQNLRQRQATNIVQVDPNLRGFTRRFDPDVSRASLLQAQRERVPTKSELEKSVGVKTVKKLKKRKKKNLRGEVARNLREQRRFERGERRDKPEQEPRIVGDPVPPAPGAAAPAAPAAPAADPNAQLRLAIEGRRIAAQDAQQRRLVDAVMARDVAERGERLAAQDRQAQERAVIIGRGEAERQALLDRQAAIAGEERQERLAILDREGQERLRILDRQARLTDDERQERQALIGRAEVERQELRGAFRTILEGETAFARQERQDFLDQSEAERGVLRREAREERVALLDDRRGLEQSQEAIRDRVEQQRIEERRAAAQERDQLLGRASSTLERLGDEERRERIQREEQQAAAQVAERERLRLEREQVSVQAAEEREGILRLTLDADRDPVPEPGNTQADREFIQRQFQQGLEQVDRRIGESEARTAEQIRQHADRVSAQQPTQPNIVINQPPINIETPAQSQVQSGPSAADIAAGVRDALQDLDLQASPRRRVPIDEDTTDTESETFSPRRSGRGGASPRADVEFQEGGIGGGFSPAQSPRQPSQIETPQSTGQELDLGPPSPRAVQRGFDVLERDLGDLFPGGLPPPQEGGGEFRGEAEPEQVVAEPAQLPSQRIPELEEQQGSAPGGERREIPTGDPEQLPREFAELGDSGVVVDRSNLPQEGGQEGGQDLFQSGLFSGNLEAAAQNAIGFVGDVAGRAAGGIANLVNPPSLQTQVGDQTGGALTDAEGNPIFGLGQEIEEPVRPTIQPLQSEQPARRVAPSPRAAGGGGRSAPADTRSKLQKDKDALKGAQSQERRLQTAQKASKFANVSGGRQAFGAKGELKQVQQKIKDLQGRIQSEEIQVRNRESMRQGAALGGGRPQQPARGLVEEEGEGEAVARVAPSARRTNLQLYEEILPEIQGSYTRGRAQGGARGSLPFQITNTSDRFLKGLEPGQTVTIDQVERDGKLGYYPKGRGVGSKAGITRIGDSELKKQVESGKLKVDRTR